MIVQELRKLGAKKIITYSAITLLVIGVIVVWAYALSDSSGPSDADTVSTDTVRTESDGNILTPTDTDAEEPEADADEEEARPDTSSFSSLTIAQMDLEVFYTEGIPGFEYQILRTPAGTQYVEFSSEDIAGTKCTDDAGTFASIIKNPSSSEGSTITATTKIGVDVYGLSLASDTCTGDKSLLSSYQSAFKSGFGSLKASESQSDE